MNTNLNTNDGGYLLQEYPPTLMSDDVILRVYKELRCDLLMKRRLPLMKTLQGSVPKKLLK
jgi:hypothetical protein